MEKVQQMVSGIEGFDSTTLRPTETNEKNPLPDKDGKYKNAFIFLLHMHTLKCAFAWN